MLFQLFIQLPDKLAWDSSNGDLLFSSTAYNGCIYKLTFSPDGMRIVSMNVEGMICIWDAETGDLLLTLEGYGGRRISSIAYSPNGRLLVTSNIRDSTVQIQIWDVENAVIIHTIEGHTRDVTSIAFSPDGTRIATGSWDGTIRIWGIPND